MFPVKRRRELQPNDEYELSMRHHGRDYEYPGFSQQNRSVRGPSLAPTSRYDVEAERHARSITHHAQSHHNIKDGHPSQPRDRSRHAPRSWHGNTPPSWPNTREYDDHSMPQDNQLEAETAAMAAASLPGLSLLMQNRQTARSGRSVDALRRAQDQAQSMRPRDRGPEKLFDQRRPGMAPYAGHTDRLRGSVDSTTTSPASMDMRDSIGSNSLEDAPIHPFPSSQAPALRASQTRNRADSSSSNASMQSTASPSFGASSSSSSSVFPLARTIAKSSRYLREIDRRNILQRIENGEKQATLAKEYQVSRAAICNLNKHREVVLSRKDENPLAKHPKKPRAKGDGLKNKPNTKATALDLNDVSPGVHELRPRAATVLMSTLINQDTPMTDFKRSAYRLLRLVVEEAISLMPLKRTQVAFKDDAAIDGVQIADPFCGVAMIVSGGGLLLQVFRELEPQRATGSIRVTSSRAVDAELPAALGDHNVFLFDLVMASSEATCLAVERLLAEGSTEDKIWLVTLSISVPVAEAVISNFPNIKIVAAQMDRSSLDADEAARAVANAAVHCLIKRFLESFAAPRSGQGPAVNRVER